MKVIVIGALPSSLLNFRKALILDLISKGHEVVTAASGATSAEVQAIEKLGVRYIDFHVERNGLNPVSDIKTYWRLRKIFKVEQPQVILAYTIKPVIWGGIAARAVPNSKFYALITGLGFAFQRGGFRRNLLRLLACKLYKFALLNAPKVIFQNRDNKGEFLSSNIITVEQSACINGSGVDLGRFSICEFPSNGFKVLTIARLLGEKGLREYAAAAKEIKKTFPNVVFQLVGPEDPSPDGIPIEEVNEWHFHRD